MLGTKQSPILSKYPTILTKLLSRYRYIFISDLSIIPLYLTETHRLQDQAALYIKKIENEKKKIEDLDMSIASYQERILEQKSRLGGINAAQENNALIQKQIQVLENRLNKTLLKFNETLAQNKELRFRIDEYRRERVVFDVIYKKLERELHEKKKDMAAIIKDSKNAYQIRDKSLSEMTALQQHADKERTEFESEFKELGDLIKQQQLMLEQLRLKQFERTNTERTITTLVSEEGGGESVNPLGAWPGTKDKSVPLSQEKIHSYEDALLRIQESTGIYDINEIVTRFLEAEEQNFSLFNYVNDINSEIERLEHSISEMRNQIEKYRGQGMSTDTQRKKTLRDLEEKLLRTDKKSDEYEARYQLAVRTITHLKNGIHSIFTRIGAQSSSVDEMLGNQGVTESNMMQYLGIIEQRTSEILQAYAASQANQPNEQYTFQLPSPAAALTAAGGDGMHATKLTVQPPSYEEMSSGENSEGEEEDERPLTRAELEKKTLKEFTRKGITTGPSSSPTRGMDM